MRPVLLKSAGIVGLAGAIMAVVSSNALFLDPGGPDRSANSGTGTVIAASQAADAASADADGDAIAAILPRLAEEPEVLTPAQDVQPETTASVIPAESSPPSQAPIVPRAVATTIIAPADEELTGPSTEAFVTPAAMEQATPEPAPAEVETLVAAVSPAPVVEDLAATDAPKAIPASPDVARAEAAKPVDPALWSDDAVECPRDWVPASDGEGARGCETLASLVADTEAPTLRKALPEDVLDLVALAPTIPVPTADPDPAPEAEQASAAPEPEAKPAPAPKPTRTARRSDWPDAPPPDCGPGKRARWHFTDRKAGTKEWYCR